MTSSHVKFANKNSACLLLIHEMRGSLHELYESVLEGDLNFGLLKMRGFH